MNPLDEEKELRTAVDRLLELLADHPVIKAYKEIEARVAENERLTAIEEQIKAAQKDAVNFAHYGKPEAEKAAIAQADELKRSYDQQPLVIAYRERLYEANDLVQYVTEAIQRQVNEELEEDLNASKN